jgi:hypothetical protein
LAAAHRGARSGNILISDLAKMVLEGLGAMD